MHSEVKTPAARPESEFKHLYRLALPLMGAQLAQMGMGVLDTVMAGRLGAVQLAGVALGGSVLFPVMMVMMGVLQSVSPSVAQLNGANRREEIGEIVRQALWMAILASIVIDFILVNARPYYELMQVDARAVEVSIPYLRYAAWGIPAVMGYFVLRFMVEGVGYTRPAMMIAVSALILKIPLNYIFMYGKLGAPELGGAGCGVSIAIVMWYQFIIMLIVATRSRFDFAGLKHRFSFPHAGQIKELLGIGLPIGATLLFEVGLFSMITVLAGRLGAEVVAAHTTAMNIGGITFMIPLALGIACTIRVGFNVGLGRGDLARETAKVALLSTMVTAVLSISLVVLFRYQIAGLYTNDPEVLSLAVRLLLFVAIFQLFDHSQATAIGALRGYKDTRFPMVVTFVCYWLIGLPVGCVLGFGWIGEPMGVIGFWIGLILSLGLVALLVCHRLLKVSERLSHQSA
jgi:MATE family multidrug resistance protein